MSQQETVSKTRCSEPEKQYPKVKSGLYTHTRTHAHTTRTRTHIHTHARVHAHTRIHLPIQTQILCVISYKLFNDILQMAS